MRPFEKDIPLYRGIIKARLSQRTAKSRTSNPNHPKFKDYMGRGIKMCRGFQDPWWFLSIMGPCAPHLSLDRIDNNGHYSCGQCDECLAMGWGLNCRWATCQQQCINRRSTVFLTLNGVTKHAEEWGEITGINPQRISKRKRDLGWTDERALTEPPRKHPVTSKFSEQEVIEIRSHYSSAEKKLGLIASLARKHKVGRDTIRNIVHGNMWRSVQNQ